MGENFPFIDARVLHPGTLVVKFGATTGITSGQLIGIRSLTYEEKGVPFAVTDAVVVQWEPGQRFNLLLGGTLEVYTRPNSVLLPIQLPFTEHKLLLKPQTTWLASSSDQWWRSIAVPCGVLAR